MSSNTKPQPKVLPSFSFKTWIRSILLDWDRTQLAISLIILALLAAAPLVIKSPYYIGIIILAVLYAFVGISWNIVAGFAGQLLIAHIIFVAVGAYTTIVLNNTFSISPWIGIPVSGVVAALLGAIVAFFTLRYGLKADYFALFSIALMVAFKTLFLKWDFVGGAVGMGLRLNDPTLAKMIFHTKEPYLYIALGLTLIGVLVQYFIYRSKMGKYFVAIREDESAAAALGVNTSRYKTLALLIGSALAGIGGGFYVMYVTFVEPPQVFDLGLNVELVLAGPIIGGLGSLLGPLVGALVNKPLAELIRGFLSVGRSGSSLIVYGSFLVLAILFMPRGIVGALQNPYMKLRAKILNSNKEKKD
ncbi:MAG TPA: branched-chain amino acid ABC transporter permease [Bellilinea sp.]|jgi:branched-chain amino acid transport system permease protein|nr:branched-chain amino acid ABC transporter permease [Bellilinea sp.]